LPVEEMQAAAVAGIQLSLGFRGGIAFPPLKLMYSAFFLIILLLRIRATPGLMNAEHRRIRATPGPNGIRSTEYMDR